MREMARDVTASLPEYELVSAACLSSRERAQNPPYGNESFSCSSRVCVVDTDNIARARAANRFHGTAELVLSLAKQVYLVY